MAIGFGMNRASIGFFSGFYYAYSGAAISTGCQPTAVSCRMLNQFLTNGDTKRQLLLKLVNNRAGSVVTKRYLRKMPVSAAAWLTGTSALESTVRRFA
jgi:hypothetical protein